MKRNHTQIRFVDSRTVAKEYPPGEDDRAAREVARLRMLSASLEDDESVTCPTVMVFDRSTTPTILMSRCVGVTLSEWIDASANRHALRDLAEHVARALGRYFDALNEPYADFTLDNVMYDSGGDRIAVLDLAPPVGMPDAALRVLPQYETTLGNCLGHQLYSAMQPSRVLRMRSNARHIGFVHTVIHHCGRVTRLDTKYLAMHARATYRRLTTTGKWQRKTWYRLGRPIVDAMLFLTARKSERSWRTHATHQLP